VCVRVCVCVRARVLWSATCRYLGPVPHGDEDVDDDELAERHSDRVGKELQGAGVGC
jgi:hypothetical protein